MAAPVNHKTTHEASQPVQSNSSPALSSIQGEQASLATSRSSSDQPKDYKKIFKDRGAHSKFADPCEDARKESMKCLDDNNYNRDSCLEFFQNYRDCKKVWLNQRREDRRTGQDV